MKKAMKQSVLTTILNAGSIAFILLASISFFMVFYFNQQSDKASLNRFDLAANAKRFMDGSAYLTSEVRSYAATGNIKHYNNYWNEINVLKNRDIGVAAIREIGITDEEEVLVKKMSDLSNNLVPLESEAMDDVMEGKMVEAVEAVFGASYESVIGEIRATQQKFLEVLDSRAESIVIDYAKRTLLFTYITGLFVMFVCIFQVLSMVTIRRKIIRPVIAVQQQMLEISNGKLGEAFDFEADTSEIGMLIHSIQQTKKNLSTYIADIAYAMGEFASNNFVLRPPTIPFVGDFEPIVTSILKVSADISKTLTQIRTAADQVSANSEQVSSGAQALAQGATEQASSVEELSASISEIYSHVSQNADGAMKANEKSIETTDAIVASNEQMQMLMSAMNDIDTKSAEISKIIKTIEDIAFQTNILALNAAVEAARAGSAGKGFAVVADEVRNLAGKSAEAARNTTALIEDSVASITKGVKLAGDTAKDLLGAVGSVRETTEIITNITNASREQAASIEQVSIGVDQISTVVQMNSATSEESAAASVELSHQASLLKELVDKFKLQNVAFGNADNEFRVESNIATPQWENSIALPSQHFANKY